MKLKLLFFSSISFLGLSASAQMMQGNVSIDPYIGVPNWANAIIYNNAEGPSNLYDYKTKGGSLSYGARIEYMISQQVGIGADVNYEVSGFQYKYEDYAYDANNVAIVDGNGAYVYENYTTEYSAKKLRAMFRLNYHFVQEEKIDMYTGFAGGYKNVNRSFVSVPNNPNANGENIGGLGALFPISFRLAVGAKMYFTPNIGAHVELGAFGGGLLQFGVSVKF